MSNKEFSTLLVPNMEFSHDIAMENFSISHSTCFILENVFQRVDIAIRSVEELWAVKFMSFIVGTNRLRLEDVTREIPVYAL